MDAAPGMGGRMQDSFQVKMDEFLPLRDVVFNTLRQAILTGELKPGERLMEIHLANKLGVSRTPIREAIRKLELEGLNLIYDIEMKTKLMEYDYEVDAISGEVIGFDIAPLKK